MPGERDDIPSLLGPVSGDYDGLTVTLESDGPPAVTEVLDCYALVRDDMNEAWALSELIDFVLSPQPHHWWQGERLSLLNSLSPGNAMSVRFPIPDAVLDKYSYALPKLSVQSSRYYNPFETIMVVTSGCTILLIASVVWAVRRLRRLKGEEQFAARLNDLLSHVSKVLASGNPAAIKAIQPIALGIIQAACRHHSIVAKVDVELVKLMKVKADAKNA